MLSIEQPMEEAQHFVDGESAPAFQRIAIIELPRPFTWQ
jgi:hypothetical protein